MERAIIHTDLKKQEIQPDKLLEKYLKLLKDDIFELLPIESLLESTCPVSGESDIRNTFNQIGLKYKISKTYQNIYLSPRPDAVLLKRFYVKSKARKFWLTKIWEATMKVRMKKIITPQLNWTKSFINQYCENEILQIAEYLPNHWGYYLGAKTIFPSSNYQLIDILFNQELSREKIKLLKVSDQPRENVLDAALLFEAIDRAQNPQTLLKNVSNSLKSGGLCFITCLLASGFEFKTLGHHSGIAIPPERMNLLSFEGINELIKSVGCFEILEFSTPGVLDIPNVLSQLPRVKNLDFINYILNERHDKELIDSFHEFLQLNRLGTFGRIVLKRK